MSESKDEGLYLDKDGKPAPLYKNDEEVEQKRGFRIGVPTFLGTLVVLVLLTSFTPLYSILMRIIPDSWQGALLYPIYRSVPLSEGSQKFDEPMEIPLPAPGTLPILGFDTGICFSFYSTISKPDPSYISAEQLKAAKDGEAIAEILAIGKYDKYEYRVQSTTYTETIDKDNKIISVICQKFGRTYANTPKKIRALYLRPIQPFTAGKTVWKSIKHLYDDYSSPLDPNGGSPQPTLFGN